MPRMSDHLSELADLLLETLEIQNISFSDGIIVLKVILNKFLSKLTLSNMLRSNHNVLKMSEPAGTPLRTCLTCFTKKIKSQKNEILMA